VGRVFVLNRRSCPLYYNDPLVVVAQLQCNGARLARIVASNRTIPIAVRFYSNSETLMSEPCNN
jgi:hypothetical protein